MDSSKKIVLPILTSHRISSSSSSMNSGNLSARGQELSPVRFNNTTGEISGFENRRGKELESSLRASMEVRSFNPITVSDKRKPDPEALQRALGSQIIPKPPERKLEAGARYERRGGRELKFVAQIKGVSKSKTPPRRQQPRDKSPVSAGRNMSSQPLQGFTPSTVYVEFTSPSPPPDTYVPNAREQLANLVLESIKANSIPIALESKQVNKKVLLVPTAEPEDISGSLIFTKQGFFEIPKERGVASRFISKKEFAMETMNIDILSKLPFVQNYHKHKQMRMWRLHARKQWYKRTREQLATEFWAVKPLFTHQMTECLDHLHEIRDLKAIDLHESYMYGKRHTDFSGRQATVLTEACSHLGERSDKLMEIITEVTQDLNRCQKQEEDDFVYKRMTEKLENRKGEGVGLPTTKRSALEERQRIDRKTHQSALLDRYLQWMLIVYQQALISAIKHNIKFIDKISQSVRRPRFELFLQANPQVEFDPSLEQMQVLYRNTVQKMQNTLTSHSSLTHLHWLVRSSFHLLSQDRFDLKSYKEFIIIDSMNEETQLILAKIQQGTDKDLAQVMGWAQKYSYLRELRERADAWMRLLDTDSDIISFYRENFASVNSYQDAVIAIPVASVNIGMFTMDTTVVRTQLQEVPMKIFRLLKDRLQIVVVSEAADLRGEVFIHFSMLEERAGTLPQYAQQVQSLAALKGEKIKKLTSRLDFLQECMKICKKENIRIPAASQLDCDDSRIMLSQLPDKISKAETECQQNKVFFEQQITRNAEKLSRKIKKFEEKYREHYLQDGSKINAPDTVLHDLAKRETALATIKQRVEVFSNFESIIETSQDAERLSCVSDFQRVFELHCDTLKCWKLISYAITHREEWHDRPFIELSFKRMDHKLNKVLHKLQPDQFSIKDVAESGVVKALKEQVTEMLELTETLRMLKDEALKPRHWEKLFQILRRPQLFDTAFTLRDLKDAKVIRFVAKIAEVLEEAKIESRQEETLQEIKDSWELLTLDTVSYRNRLDIFVLSNCDKLQFIIEEHQTRLETLELSKNTDHLRADIVEWKEKLQTMGRVMDVWTHCQNAWMLFEPIFTSDQLNSVLPKEYEIFKEVQTNLKKIMWSAHQSPKALQNLLVPNRREVLESILQECELLRKTVKDYLESRRIAYPRFFFFSDSQLLEFLSKVHAGQQFDHCITVIFPGISMLYIRKVQPQQDYDPDLDLAPFNKFTPASDELLDPFDFSSDEEASLVSVPPADLEPLAEPDRGILIAEKQKRLKDQLQEPSIDWKGPNLCEIVGIQGHNLDLLLLETPVAVHSGVETWLSELEIEIGTTLKKLVSSAIASFPKQSLDEWILDYPIQTILATITLIITHEITELFSGFRSQGSSRDPGTDNPSYSEVVDEPVTEKYESHFSKVFFSSDQESESVMDQSRIALVKLLQSKSYKGLYLRLQFWVNQIANTIKADGMTMSRLQPLHRMSLSNFVTMLLYQRDVVFTLHKQKVRSDEDFEWRKLLRIYLGANEQSCRVECGGWGMAQEQEYLGAGFRLLNTPETTRCFLYLSSVLRESGSVLFQPVPGNGSSSDVVSEFANVVGVCCKQLTLSADFSVPLLMNFLNGAALSHTWLSLEEVTALPLAALHAVIRETQMVKQQFLIAGVGDSTSQDIPPEQNTNDPSRSVSKEEQEDQSSLKLPPDQLESLSLILHEGTVLQKTVSQSLSQSSQREEESRGDKQGVIIRSNKNMFVVFASLAQVSLPENDEFLRSAKAAFRVKELVKPPYSFTMTGLLLLKGFRAARVLGNKTQEVLMKLTSFNVHPTMRDMYKLVALADMVLRTFPNPSIDIEELAVATALKTWLPVKRNPTQIDLSISGSNEELVNHRLEMESCISAVFVKSEFSLIGKSLETAIQDATTRLHLGFQDWQERLITSLFLQLTMHRGVIVYGPKGSGKSACTRILLDVLRAVVGLIHVPVNPDVLGPPGLFGRYDTEETCDGLLLQAFQSSGPHLLQFMCDQAQSWWLEPFIPCMRSSVLTHSELRSMQVSDFLLACSTLFKGCELHITLPTGVQVSLPPGLLIVSEVADLSQISPVLLTSFGMAYVSGSDLTWDVLLTPAMSLINEKYLKYGLSAESCLQAFKAKIQPLVEAADLRFKKTPIWNLRRQIKSFADLLLGVLSSCVEVRLQVLGEVEGLTQSSALDYNQYIEQNAHNPKIREAKELFSFAMVITFAWSFGSALGQKEKAVLSQLITESKSLIQMKYMYPRNSNLFETFFDWKTKEFGKFDKGDITQLSTSALYDQDSKTLCVPTLSFQQLRYVVEMAMFGNSDVMVTEQPHASVWINVQGEEGAGKTACVRYLMQSFRHSISTASCSVSPLFSVSKLTACAFSLFSWKTRTSAVPISSHKSVILVDDLHLDESCKTHVREAIEFWVAHKGCYDPCDHVLKTIKELSFLTLSHLQPQEHGFSLFLEAPDSAGMKAILTAYIFSKKFTTDSLVQRYSTTLIHILLSARKVRLTQASDLQTLLGPHRVFTALTHLVQATVKLELLK